MKQAAKPRMKHTSRKNAAKIVKAIGLSKILTAYEEANRPLPATTLSEFRLAVGLSARPPKFGSRASMKRFALIEKLPFGDRHKLFYEFWDEYFDFKVEATEYYDESPEWLQTIANEVFSEIDADL